MRDTYSSASTTGLLSRILSFIVPSWKNRQDSEHEQAVIRFIVGFIASVYLLAISQEISESNYPYLITKAGVIIFFILAISIIIWLSFSPAINVPRRVFGCLLDNAGATAALFINGNLAAPMFVVYLWVTFGNGFRYGKEYLFFSMVLNIIGFSSVLFVSGSWSYDSRINLGLLIGLIALPLYVVSLISRLEKALVRASVANQAKVNFLATMSHEIRTPLNGLIGVLGLLDMTSLKEKQQHYVNLMKSSSEWLLSVISDGLDFTKIEADELIIEAVPIDLKSTLQDISSVFLEISRAKNITFSSNFAEDIPGNVIVDKTRLTQVINNLLNNACKFTERGSVRFEVTKMKSESNRVRLNFRISDSGIGIAEENLGKIFSPFKQIEYTSFQSSGGTGLGLAIAARLIKLMGGEIQVASKLGVGTSFSFYLDLKTSGENKSEAQESYNQGIKWQRQPNILLVEDNLINQEVAATYLTYLGCKVDTANDGLEAVDMTSNSHFDLILMDCQMPLMGGYEATKKIRAAEKDNQRNIIIALTAHITLQDRQKCLKVGMDDYMGKPFKLESLLQTLHKWLNHLLSEHEGVAPHFQLDKQIDETSHFEEEDVRNQVHDLRNLLGGVIGGVELAMLCKDDQEKQDHQLSLALESAQRAVRVASDFKNNQS